MTERAMTDDETLKALQRLQRLMPKPQEAHALMMLLGNGLAESLTGFRARQALLEQARASARRSAVADARRAEADASADALRVVRAEVRRLRVVEPASGESSVGVYGHVVDRGRPVAGAMVAAMHGDDVLARVDTAKDGSFALSIDSAGPLGLQVSVGETVVHRDDVDMLRPGPLAAYRLVDLAEENPDRPTENPRDGSGGNEDDRPSDKVGEVVEEPAPAPFEPRSRPDRSLIHTLRDLGLVEGRRVVLVRLAAGDRATPRVVRRSEDADGALVLDVEGRVTDAGRLAVVASLLAHQPEAEGAGIDSAVAATALLEQGGVTTWDEAQRAARLNLAALAERFGLAQRQAAALRSALMATMSAIKVVGEE